MSEQKEAELTFVCKLTDVKQLLQAESCELQEQYMICTLPSEEDPNKREFRIRKSSTKEGVTYTATSKVRASDKSVLEKEAPSSEEEFQVLKQVANSGMRKYRYKFPYPELVNDTQIYWEVDIYTDDADRIVPWCRVELEFPSDTQGNVYLPDSVSELPIQFEEVLSQADKRDEVQAKISELYGQYFISGNPQAR